LFATVKFLAYHIQKKLLKEEHSKLKRILKTNRYYDLAHTLIKNKIKPEFDIKTIEKDTIDKFPIIYSLLPDDIWYYPVLILLLCKTTKEKHSFSLLLGTLLPFPQVFDIIYSLMTCLWSLHITNELCLKDHNQLYYVMFKIENSSVINKTSIKHIKLTPEQMRVVKHKFKKGHLLRVMAYAGTGKTTTLIQLAQANPNLAFLYSSFSKSVITDARTTFCFHKNVDVTTFHSLAYNAMGMSNYRKKLSRQTIYLSDIRERLEIKENVKNKEEKKESDKIPIALCVRNTLFKFMASECLNISLNLVQTDVLKYKDEGMPPERVPIPLDIRREILDLTKEYWRNMTDMNNTHWPMNDDCYLKLWQLSNPKILDYDVIMIDEAQDLTDCMLSIMKMQKPHVSLVFVGDPHQSIYGFRYAKNALCKPIFPRTTSYLTQSFRFGEEIATVADGILQNIKFKNEKFLSTQNNSSSSKKHLVGVGRSGLLTGALDDFASVTYLCRTNVGVVMKALQMIDENKDKGKSIGIIGGAQRMGFKHLLDLYALSLTKAYRIRKGLKCTVYTWNQLGSLIAVEKFATENEDTNLLSKIEIVKKLQDKIPEAVEKLKQLPSATKQSCNIQIGTVHQAKGLEFDHVAIVDFSTINALAYAQDGLNKVSLETINLFYVAVTRAKKSLILNSDMYKLLCKWNALKFNLCPKTNNDETFSCPLCHTDFKQVEDYKIEVIEIPKFVESGNVCKNCLDKYHSGWSAFFSEPASEVL